MPTQLPDHIDSFVRHLKADNIPPPVLRQMGLLLLDTLGIAAAASPMEAGIIARDAAALLYGTTEDAMRAQMMFDGRSVSLAGAAFAAATQIDNLDGHDGYNPTKGHIGVAVVPALIAAAQQEPRLTGRDALTALVIGYEVAGRAGIALHDTVTDYHTSGAWNALGVVAMLAHLRGSSKGVLREALGIAEYHGPRSQMMREIAYPTMLHDGSGMGAMVGVSALIMAERGFKGAPAITVEASQVQSHWDDLGQFWQVSHQYIKPYPICRWAHAAIDALARVCQDHQLTADMIAKVEIATFHNAVQLFQGIPATTSQAQYAIHFPVATMIVHRSVGVRHITDDGLTDPLVANMMARISVCESKAHEARYPKERWADVTITLKDGTVLQSGDVHARGGPEDPFGDAEIIDKFMSFASAVLGQARADAICDACLSLSDADAQFSRLLRLLRAPHDCQS